jgi:hypothetical protein
LSRPYEIVSPIQGKGNSAEGEINSSLHTLLIPKEDLNDDFKKTGQTQKPAKPYPAWLSELRVQFVQKIK